MTSIKSTLQTHPEIVLRDGGIPVTGSTSAGAGLPDTILAILDGYGCYCNFLSGVFEKAHGHPADGLDSICKQWHMGYACAAFDQESCLSLDVDYVSVTPNQNVALNYIIFVSFDPFIPEVNSELLIADCQASNANDPCATQACIIDGTFVTTVQAYLMESEVAGQFPIPGTPCPESEKHEPLHGPPMNCCGSASSRFLYLTDGGNRACCGEKTYETDLLECCDVSTSTLSTVC